MVDWSSGNVSETAANMALIRALETQKAPDQWLFSDPFARRFLPLWQRALLSPACFPGWRRIIEGIFDGKAPGARTSGAAARGSSTIGRAKRWQTACGKW
jgi:O-methyltransferase involved in polyketide biosynthesis